MFADIFHTSGKSDEWKVGNNKTNSISRYIFLTYLYLLELLRYSWEPHTKQPHWLPNHVIGHGKFNTFSRYIFDSNCMFSFFQGRDWNTSYTNVAYNNGGATNNNPSFYMYRSLSSGRDQVFHVFQADSLTCSQSVTRWKWTWQVWDLNVLVCDFWCTSRFPASWRQECFICPDCLPSRM